MTGYFCNKLPFALDYILPITNQIGRLIEILSGHQKKCLVLDLDNTLWGGVVGDLGTQGIVLDPNDAEGEAYRFFQSYVKSLKERGVILAVCSKNDMEVATAPFVENPNMILCRDDISCFIANWEDKASNLKRIAKELNIGLDSLVFFDDNPAEREIIHSYLPSVTVIDVPEDVDSYALALDHSGVFDWIEITNEDIGRVQTYQANAERKKLEETAVDYDQYLRSLEMVGEVSRIKEADVERFTQLINKSNQFNLRTMRYNDKQIQDMLHDESYILLGVKLKDKFSFYGIIACVILHIEDTAEVKTCFIDSFVMSCR
ncbi:MAG: HAD-IIIC family phosphatase, partial [Raoultibacter sp.]